MFDDKPFAMLPMRNLARGFLGQSEHKIGLPGFQRNAVWKEDKVEALWDSLLCRFPIGSILLARYHDFSEVGYRKIQINRSSPYSDTLVDGSGGEYIVVDGQQRLNAITLGFLPFVADAPARLWVDLGAPKDENKRLW